VTLQLKPHLKHRQATVRLFHSLYLDFTKIVSRTLLLESERELCNVPPSPSSAESASTASSMQPPYILPPKRAPAIDPPFRLDGKTKDHVLMKFPAARSDSSQIRRCSVCLKNINETRWCCRKCGVPLHPGKCDTRYHTPKVY
jgi:hypothetical protein